MVVVHQGKAVAPQVVPEPLYAGMVLVTAATSILAPLALRPLLSRWERDFVTDEAQPRSGGLTGRP